MRGEPNKTLQCLGIEISFYNPNARSINLKIKLTEMRIKSENNEMAGLCR